MSDDILPQEVKVQLQTLDREYEEEEWTRKGYLKHQQMLLEPYTEVLKEWETHHLSEVEQQRQLIANGSEVLHEEGLEQSETEELGGGGGSRRDGRDVAKASKTHKDGQDGLSPPAEEVMEDGTDPPPPTGRRLLSWVRRYCTLQLQLTVCAHICVSCVHCIGVPSIMGAIRGEGGG